MMRMNRDAESSALRGNTVRGTIMGIMVVAAVILLAVICFQIGRGRRISDPVNSMQYSLKQGYYNSISSEIATCRRRGYEGNSEYKKYEAIADYYRESFKKKAFETMAKAPASFAMSGSNCDYSVKAAECQAALEEAKSHMGELVFAADEIDMYFTD